MVSQQGIVNSKDPQEAPEIVLDAGGLDGLRIAAKTHWNTVGTPGSLCTEMHLPPTAKVLVKHKQSIEPVKPWHCLASHHLSPSSNLKCRSPTYQHPTSSKSHDKNQRIYSLVEAFRDHWIDMSSRPPVL